MTPRAAGIVGAFLRRDWSNALSYRLPFVLDLFYGMLQLAVYFFVSRAVDVSSEDLHGAPSYFAFAAVGVVMSLVVDSASDGLASRVRNEQLTGSLEVLTAEPLRPAQLCAGLTAFPFAFAVVRATFYLIVAGIAMELDLSRASWVGVVAVFATAALAMAALGILAGAVVLVLKRGEVLASMALFAMTLVAGSVFPVSVLPDWLAAVSELLPLRYAFDGLRDALFLGSGWGGDALALLGFAVVTVPLATWAFSAALEHARRAGTMGQY